MKKYYILKSQNRTCICFVLGYNFDFVKKRIINLTKKKKDFVTEAILHNTFLYVSKLAAHIKKNYYVMVNKKLRLSEYIQVLLAAVSLKNKNKTSKKKTLKFQNLIVCFAFFFYFETIFTLRNGCIHINQGYEFLFNFPFSILVLDTYIFT